MYYRVGPIRCRILSAGVQPIRALLFQCRFMSRAEAAQILGVEPNASKKEIKTAYIKQAKIYHPDSKVKLLFLIGPLGRPIRLIELSFRPDVKQNFDSFKRLQMFYKNSIKYQIQKRNITTKKLIQMKF